jgi:hypothetical protein
MATFTDDFARIDEALLGTPWTPVVGNGLTLVSEQVGCIDGGSFYVNALIGQDFEDDQYAEVTLPVQNFFDDAGVGVRFDNAGNGYAVSYIPSGTDYKLYSFVNGVESLLLDISNIPLSITDRLGLGIVGNVLTVYRNDVPIGTFTDTSNTHTAGVTALFYRRGNNGSTRLDNFSATGLIPAAGTNYTVDFPDVTAFTEDTAGLPFTSAAYQNELVVTDGTDTAAINIIREPKAGYTVVETISATNVKGSIFESRVGGAPFDGSQVYYSTAGNTTISATGIITTALETFVADVWDVTTGIWEKATFDAAVSRYTFDLPDVTTFTNPTVGLPFTSAAYQNEIVATDGTNTAAINVVHNPKDGYAVIDIVNGTTVKGSIFETRIGGAPFDGSQVYYPTANNTSIDATGIISTDSTELTAYVWDVTSKNWNVVTFDAVRLGHIKTGTKTVNVTNAQYVKATTPINTFSLNGSGFGTKAQASPIKYDDFQAYTDDTTLQANDAQWQEYQTNGGALIRSARSRYTGAKHAYNDSTRSGFATNSHTFPATNEVFISYWFSTDEAVYNQVGGTSWVGKLSRITSSPASGGGGVYNGLGVHALSDYDPDDTGSPYLLLSNGGAGLGSQPYINIPMSNTWYRIDMHVKLSDVDAANGVFNCRTWNHETYTNNSVSNLLSGFPYQLDSVLLGVMQANHTGAPAGMKLTDIHIDNTPQRVDLTESPDYATSTWAEVQDVTTWSDTNAAGNIRTNGRSGRAFLHVIDANGNSVHNEQVII